MSKIFFLTLAVFFLLLGIVGAFLPILPTVPFLLLSVFFAAKGSRRFHNWLINTQFYEKHMRSYTEDKTMKWGTKCRILILASSMLLLGFYFTPNIYVRIFIVILIILKYAVILFVIPTRKTEPTSPSIKP